MKICAGKAPTFVKITSYARVLAQGGGLVADHRALVLEYFKGIVRKYANFFLFVESYVFCMCFHKHAEIPFMQDAQRINAVCFEYLEMKPLLNTCIFLLSMQPCKAVISHHHSPFSQVTPPYFVRGIEEPYVAG